MAAVGALPMPVATNESPCEDRALEPLCCPPIESPCEDRALEPLCCPPIESPCEDRALKPLRCLPIESPCEDQVPKPPCCPPNGGRRVMAMATAIAQTKWEGEPWEKLELMRKEIPLGAKPGHLLLRMQARGISHIDIDLIRFNHFANKNVPEVFHGVEGLGVIEAVGDGVTGFTVGQRVCPFQLHRFQATGQGTWQQYLEVPATEAFPVPDHISDQVAAQIFGTPFTVVSLFEQLEIPKGEFLIQAATNTVAGRMVIQLAKHLGIKTISIIRGLRGGVKEELQELGADEILTIADDIPECVRHITGGKLAYAAVDGMGGKLTQRVAAAVRDGGQHFVYGLHSGIDFKVPESELARHVKVQAWSLASHLKTSEDCNRLGNTVLDLLKSGALKLHGEKSFGLEAFQEAIKESMTAKESKVLIVG